MKKITLLVVTLVCAAFVANAQFTFPTIPGPVNVPNAAPVTQNFNDAGNSAGVPAATYNSYILTVDWENSFDAWSVEAEVDVTIAAGSTGPAGATTGAATSGDPTTLTFEGVLPGAGYDPSVDGTLDIQFSQTWGGSDANWSNISLTLESNPAPNCAELPITPMDGETDLPAFDPVTISWTPPSSGVTPTSYDLYVGTMMDGSDQALFLNTTDTFASAPIGDYNTTIYWSVVPKNGAIDAVGCQTTLYSFSSGNPPPPPANDNLCNPIMLTVDDVSSPTAYTDESATAEAGEVEGACFNGGINGSVWFTFFAPASGEVRVTTDFEGSVHTDTELAVYEAPTDCNDASSLGTELGCSQDEGDAGSGFLSEVDITGLTPGTMYFIQVDRWGTANPGSFGLSVFDFSTLSLDEVSLEASLKYYPNPVSNIMTLKAPLNIDNITVFNIAGQRVLESTPNSSNVDLDMSALQTGAYFVRVQSANSSKTIKVMKQ